MYIYSLSMYMKNFTFVAFTFLLFQISFAQLTDFTLTVVKTDESCTGNGSLTFTTANTTNGSTIIYSVYLHPNLTNPIAVLNTANLTGLSAGLYRVVATQSLGNLSNSQQVDIEIIDVRIPIVYTLTSQPANCYVPGSITVLTTNGNPVTYEIIAGPVIVAPQTSPVFTNIPAGTYDIRVNDSCGDGVVQTHTVQESEIPNLNIAITPGDTPCTLVDCDTRGINFDVTPETGSVIHYPFQLQLTVYPPGGGTPFVINQTITSGDPLLMSFDFTIPFYNVPGYEFDIVVIGPCGEETQLLGSEITAPSSFVLDGGINPACDNYLQIDEICNMLPPYQVSFVGAPAGFNPVDFNPNGVGPFATYPITYSSPTQNLPVGLYTVEVIDSCGHTVQHTFEIKPPETQYILLNAPCSTEYYLVIQDILTLTWVGGPAILGLQFPINLNSEIVFNNYQTILTVPGTYIYEGIGVCGNFFHFEIVIPEDPFIIDVVTNNLAGCSTNYGTIRLTSDNDFQTVIITGAPAGYTFPLPHNVSSTINSSGCFIQNLPPGEYTLSVTDICGNIEIVTAIVPVIISQGPLVSLQARGCGPGFDSIVFISPNGAFTEFIITAAPSAFPFPLPYDASFNIASNGFFCMNSLPIGSYTFYSKDECDVERNVTMPLTGFIGTDTTTIIPNCGSFDVNLQYPNNGHATQNFWLQKYNNVTGQWVHPLTGQAYTDGTVPTDFNSYHLDNLSVNYNIASTGTFRIMIEYKIYRNGVYAFESCLEVIRTFEFTGTLNIESGYTISCNSGSLEIVIIASGVAPFIYTITSRDGQPFYVNNGNSNLFTGLQPGIYNFQILDSCGNILNKLIDLNTLAEPVITPTNLCQGEVGQLSVPAISYLSYQWWKGTDTATILSTTNSLSFNPFSTVTSPGTYYVRIYSTSPLSCIDKIISFVVDPFDVPNAGLDGTLNLCGTSTAVNLFNVLSGTFDNNGTWEEVTSSGMLTGNTWTPNGISYGQYVFNYTVNGFCDTSDMATVTINFNAAPSVPVINGDSAYCSSDAIELQVNDIPDAVFEWTGPNDFSSNNQNIIIPNASEANTGTYTVTATLNGCETTSSINVEVNAGPEFILEALCIATEFTIRVIPVENSFDPSTATYLWSGPNAFISSDSQIVINNQQLGTYAVTVTNNENCSQTRDIQVTAAVCDIPNVITPNNDGSNDSFDLTGFDVDKFMVYSRWGRLVYEKNNYSNGWWGQNMQNKPLPDSTYYYVLLLRNGEEKHGWVLIAR